MEAIERESLAFDVVIVGAGPAGLACAIKIKQLALLQQQDISVCVVEKGAEVGAHILSGGVFETRALDELLPNWRNMNAPINTPVTADQVYYFANKQFAWQLPEFFIPKPMKNKGNYIVSMGNICRWLAQQAEGLGVEVFAGFPAQDVLYNSDGSVGGVITGDMGLDKNNQPKASFVAGIELTAKYTIFAEGSRGHLGKQLIERFQLAKDKVTQHYALGFKEVWQVAPQQHQPGLVVHTAGWPLGNGASGGGYLYHGDNNQVYVGLIVNLNYRNPYLDPFAEFQRYKQHPNISRYLAGGRRVSYGARAITKGGFDALPSMVMPGALLIGCNAGTINFAKIKGNHSAMKSGMLAAETVVAALAQQNDGVGPVELTSDFQQRFEQSWLYQELVRSRNFGAVLAKFGPLIGGAYNWLEQNVFAGRLPVRFQERLSDHHALTTAKQSQPLSYEQPDGLISFDKLSSVYLANTYHQENQPCHLQLTDESIPLTKNLPIYQEPAQRYCPAAVYEVVELAGEQKFIINSQNCLHCKTCDIKDPSQNITWRPPEGGGGPNYSNM